MKIVLTGAGGFLGWHTRLRLHALTDHEVVPVTRTTWTDLPRLVADADAVIHLAGVNRAESGDAVREGNLELADDLASALTTAGRDIRVVYANSIQAGNETPYGDGKAGAASRIASAVNSGRIQSPPAVAV